MVELNRIVTKTSKVFIPYKFYGNENSDFVFVPILKNAHNFGIQHFTRVANFHETDDFANKTYIIFLREPFKRWLTATAQWFNNTLPEGTTEFHIDPLMMKMIFSAVAIDGHAYRQIDSFQHLDFQKKSVFFNIDDPDFEYKLKHFTMNRMSARFVKKPFNKVNEKKGNPLKDHIEAQLLDYANSNPLEKEKIQYYYYLDFDLFKKSHFYLDQ